VLALRRVVAFASVALASVGVSEAGAGSPTSGAWVRSLTTTFPTGWIFLSPPAGSASSQWVPGSSGSSSVTKISSASPGSTGPTPI